MKFKEALEMGMDCGLSTVQEAVRNIEIHSVNFFIYEKIRAELKELYEEKLTRVHEMMAQERKESDVVKTKAHLEMEAGKKRLAGDTARAANTDEVKELRREAKDLKEVVAEQTLELRLLKKSMYDGGGEHE